MNFLTTSKVVFTLGYIHTSILYIPGSIAAPISQGNGTPPKVEVETTPWQSEPAVRGTFRLLISCLITLSLCAWTALHLNIPQPNLSTIQWYQKKAKWLLIGIFAPELVAFTAWDQWSDAKELTVRVNEIFRSRAAANEPDFSPRKHAWTLVHSHYACMGGFVFDTRPRKPHEAEYIPNSPQLALNSYGVLFLAQNANLPDISVESIQDHSKADDLAKILVIMQASWIIIDSIARIISQLPLTLLEVNTVAHVLCAFAIYALWWDKPLNVFVPTVLSEEWARPISAFMYMASGVSIGYEKMDVKTEYVPLPNHKGHWLGVKRECEFSDLTWSPIPGSASILSQDSLQIPNPQVQDCSSANSITTIAAPNTPVEGRLSNGNPHKLPGQAISTTGATLQLQMRETLPNTGLSGNPNSAYYISQSSPIVSLDRAGIVRWQLSSQAITTYLKYPEVIFTYTNRAPEIKPELRVHYDLLETHALNWARSDGWIAPTATAIASAIYAGVHVAAWNTYFPTKIESRMWQDSALAIAICSINVAIVPPLDRIAKWVRHKTPWWHYWMEEHCAGNTNYSWRRVIWMLYMIPVVGFNWAVLVPLGLLYNFLKYSATVQPFYDAADLVVSFPQPKNILRSILALALVTGYCVARVYIVVEAFISLRKLPIKVYETSRWTQMLPHI